MSITLFSRFLTIKSEQHNIEISLDEDSFVKLLENLYATLENELKPHSIGIYMYLFKNYEYILNNLHIYKANELLTGFDLAGTLFNQNKTQINI
jgi:hypothetical protein